MAACPACCGTRSIRVVFGGSILTSRQRASSARARPVVGRERGHVDLDLPCHELHRNPRHVLPAREPRRQLEELQHPPEPPAASPRTCSPAGRAPPHPASSTRSALPAPIHASRPHLFSRSTTKVGRNMISNHLTTTELRAVGLLQAVISPRVTGQTGTRSGAIVSGGSWDTPAPTCKDRRGSILRASPGGLPTGRPSRTATAQQIVQHQQKLCEHPEYGTHDLHALTR
jgi:hypothetical protein